MDLENYKNILIGFRSQVPELQDQCNNMMMQFREQNYPQFILNNIMILSNPAQDVTNASYAATLIHNEAKNGLLFESTEAATTFWGQLVQFFPIIFESPTLNDNIKLIVAHTMALFAIHFYHQSQDIQIQTYILNLFKSRPEFETFIISSVMDIVMACEQLGGFSDQILLQFLFLNLQSVTSYIPRCKLFFAIALQMPTNEISQLFGQMYNNFQNIPPVALKDFFSVIENFSEKGANFFEPHLSTFIPNICQIALNKEIDNDIRNMALYCLGAIGRNAPNMCQLCPAFYQNAISCLIYVMAEVNDDTPFEYDPNNSEPCLTAREVFKTIQESGENLNANYLSVVEGMWNQISEQKTNVPWPIIHSLISAFCEFGISINPIQENPSGTDQTAETQRLYQIIADFANRFVPFLLDLSTHPKVRIMIYELFSTHSEKSFHFQISTQSFLLPILKQMVFTETIKEVQIAAIDALTLYLRRLKPEFLETCFPALFPELLMFIRKSPQYLYIPIIKCLGTFAVAKKSFSQCFSYYANIIFSLYSQSNDANIKMISIKSLTDSLEILFNDHKQFKDPNNPMKSQLPTNLVQILVGFLGDLIQMEHGNLISDSDQDYFQAVMSILPFIGVRIEPFVPYLIEKALTKGSEKIQLGFYGILETVDQPDLFIQIPSDQSGKKLYALKSDVISVCNYLKMMNRLCSCLKMEVRPFLQKITEVIQNWITSEYQIMEVKRIVWQSLCLLNRIFASDKDVISVLIPLTFQDFNMLITINLNLFINNTKVIQTFEEFLKPMERIIEVIGPFWFDGEIITQTLNNLSLFTECVVLNRDKVLNELMHFSSSETNSKLSDFYFELQDRISMLYTSLFKSYTEITIIYFQNTNFVQKLNEFILSRNSVNFASKIMTDYITKLGDLQTAMNWMTFLFDLGVQCQHDFSSESFLQLISLILTFQLPNEFAEILCEKFQDFFGNLASDDASDNLYCFSDAALGPFTVLIQTNAEKIDYKDAIQTWSDAFPVWEETPAGDYVYIFIAELYEKGSEVVLGDDNFERFMENCLNNIYNESMMSNQTSERIANDIRSIMNNPEYQGRVSGFVENLPAKKKDVLMSILQPNNYVEEDGED